jgi:hypothetical protein
MPTRWLIAIVIGTASVGGAWTMHTFQINHIIADNLVQSDRIRQIEVTQEARNELLIRIDQRLLRIEDMLRTQNKQ